MLSSGSGSSVYRRLRSRDSSDRHAIRRAADVVEAGELEERDRVGVAAVLAADTEPELRLLLPSGPRREPHEPSHARLVDRLERAPVDHLRLDVAVQEAALDVVAGETERGLREVIRTEREEVRVGRDAIRDEAGARQLDHRAHP